MNQDVKEKDSTMVLLLKDTEFPDVRSKQEKFERMFNVTLTIREPRVIKLNGGLRDCVNARTFIKATLQSHENETRVIYLPPTTDDFIESIEIKSLASITKHTPDGSYHVRGKKIHVSMAMTLLEEYAQLEKQFAEMQTTPLRAKTNKASKRLSCALQETLTKVNRRGNYVHATDAVKRAIVGCLLDENEDNGRDQVDTISDTNTTNENITNTTEVPDVILIEDDSDDEIIEIVEEEDDDDIMIIETPRKIPTNNDNIFFGKHFDNKPYSNDPMPYNVVDDSVIIIDTPYIISPCNQKASGEREDELSTMTRAFSELQTPSKLKAGLQSSKDTNANETNKKRKLPSSDEEIDDFYVSPNSGQIHRGGKIYVPEETVRKRRILKSKITKTNNDANNEKCRTELIFNNSSNDTATGGNKNVSLGDRDIKQTTKESLPYYAQTKPVVSKRVRKITSLPDITSDDSTERRTVKIIPTIRADRTSYPYTSEIRACQNNTSNYQQYTIPTILTDRANYQRTSDENIACRNNTGIYQQPTKSTNLTDETNYKCTSDEKITCQNNSSHYPQPTVQTNANRGSALDETDGKHIANSKHVIPPLQDYRTPRRNNLRYIVIDGSNVAMSHGKHSVFSCRGIRICVEYFRRRGHELITVFLPHWRKCRPRDMNSVTHRYELEKLEKEGYLVYTPSRRIRNKLVAAYDDRFIIELADREDGIVVTNDEYRDLKHEKYSWRNIIENRLLQYSFVHDHFMVPNDPLGRYGPTLDSFLRHTDLRQTLKALEAQNIMSRSEDRTGDFLMYSCR